MKRGILRVVADGGLMFWCPGCDGAHQVQVGRGSGPRWGFNEDYGRPTFTPSVLVRGTQPITNDERDRILAGETIEPRPFVCHSFVRDGQIQFLSDCTHELAGQTVPLRDFDEA
ncbi:MAG: ammonia monooxygenase [Rhizobiales bacterium]|nr:ammonia monooxygenase [Hyphomicrobiales bacterium]MBN9001509.1 ammonia monooxygenase [Hyphomicrobiales bacterium]